MVVDPNNADTLLCTLIYAEIFHNELCYFYFESLANDQGKSIKHWNIRTTSASSPAHPWGTSCYCSWGTVVGSILCQCHSIDLFHSLVCRKSCACPKGLSYFPLVDMDQETAHFHQSSLMWLKRRVSQRKVEVWPPLRVPTARGHEWGTPSLRLSWKRSFPSCSNYGDFTMLTAALRGNVWNFLTPGFWKCSRNHCL